MDLSSRRVLEVPDPGDITMEELPGRVPGSGRPYVPVPWGQTSLVPKDGPSLPRHSSPQVEDCRVRSEDLHRNVLHTSVRGRGGVCVRVLFAGTLGTVATVVVGTASGSRGVSREGCSTGTGPGTPGGVKSVTSHLRSHLPEDCEGVWCVGSWVVRYGQK